MDAIAGLSERLRDMHPNMQQVMDIDILLEAATQLDALSARVKELEASLDFLKDRFADAAQSVSISLGAYRETELRALTAEARATRLQQERDTLSADCSSYASQNTNLRNDLVLVGMARDSAQQERDEAYERAAGVAKDRAEKLRLKAKSLKQPHNQHYFAQAIEASVIESAIRRLAAGPDNE